MRFYPKRIVISATANPNADSDVDSPLQLLQAHSSNPFNPVSIREKKIVLCLLSFLSFSV